MITVVNVKHVKSGYVYVGRSSGYGGPTPLGNPYHIGRDGSRFDVVERYDEWIWSVIQSEQGAAYTELLRLAAIAKDEDLILGCHCSPEKCHADMIAQAIIWLNNRA